MKIRVESLIMEGEGILFENHHIITTEQYRKFKQAVKDIEIVKQSRQLHKIIRYNHDDWENYVTVTNDLLFEHYIKAESVNLRDQNGDPYHHLNRLFLNYLSSVRSYIHHTETYFVQRYGRKSTEVQRLKLILCEPEKHFIYNFLSELRNYSQHCGLPIANYRLEVSDENGKKGSKLYALIERDSILDRYNKWKNLRKGIKELPEQFDVVLLLKGHVKALNIMQEKIDALTRELAEEPAKFLNELFGPFKNKPGQVSIIRYDGNNDILYPYEAIPYALMDLILNPRS